jgi:hypothetical protein
MSEPVERVDLVTTAQVATAAEAAISAIAGGVIKVHGSNASAARPDTDLPVVWFGTVNPINADDDLDVFVLVTSTS